MRPVLQEIRETRTTADQEDQDQVNISNSNRPRRSISCHKSARETREIKTTTRCIVPLSLPLFHMTSSAELDRLIPISIPSATLTTSNSNSDTPISTPISIPIKVQIPHTGIKLYPSRYLSACVVRPRTTMAMEDRTWQG